ncbi:hypothetical protein [Streptomyces sp. NPDC048737]|uniref:hypothetical protein n=1 Tax=unclassified Streptomyces TaxID=2593676 RepID=UPI003421C137
MCRSETPLDEREAVIGRHDGVGEHERRPGGWQIARYPGPVLADEGPAMLAGLAEETGHRR